MTSKNPYRPFTPDPELVSRLPAVTGAEINGVGETKVRRPRMVYWAPDPDDIEFGEVQKLLVDANTVFWGVTESVHLVDVINQTDLAGDIDG